MKHYVVYDGNGRIIQFGTCMDEDLHLQARAGLFVIEGEEIAKIITSKMEHCVSGQIPL
jgi:hypothetical protein